MDWQLNDASYFMSVWQVMLAVKKIHIFQLQLAKCHQGQLDIQTDCDVSSSLLSNDIEWLASQLSIPEECDLTPINSDLVYILLLVVLVGLLDGSRSVLTAILYLCTDILIQ